MLTGTGLVSNENSYLGEHERWPQLQVWLLPKMPQLSLLNCSQIFWWSIWWLAGWAASGHKDANTYTLNFWKEKKYSFFIRLLNELFKRVKKFFFAINKWLDLQRCTNMSGFKIIKVKKNVSWSIYSDCVVGRKMWNI